MDSSLERRLGGLRSNPLANPFNPYVEKQITFDRWGKHPGPGWDMHWENMLSVCCLESSFTGTNLVTEIERDQNKWKEKSAVERWIVWIWHGRSWRRLLKYRHTCRDVFITTPYLEWPVSVLSQIDRTQVGQATMFIWPFRWVTKQFSVRWKQTGCWLRRICWPYKSKSD